MSIRQFTLGSLAAGLGLVLSSSCGGNSSSDSGSGSGHGGTTAGASSGATAGAGRGGSGGSGTGGAAGATGGSASGRAGSGGTNAEGAGRSAGGASGASGTSGAATSGGMAGRGTGGDGARSGGPGGGEAGLASGGAAGVAGNSGGSGVTPCDDACTNALNECCDDHCVNTKNDPFNCGTCGNQCTGGTPLCSNGTCITPDCPSPDVCPALGSNEPRTCCGSECCRGAALCCAVPGPVATTVKCFDPTESEGTCPRGCNACRCAAPDTPIATPNGERAIAELRVGDLVYSMERGAVVVVPIRAVHREPVLGSHSVTRVTLTSGAVLDISRGHPTADGRTFADLRAGDRLGDVPVAAVVLDTPYAHAFTYDILPDSPGGTYFAAGALIGSTLAEPVCVP